MKIKQHQSAVIVFSLGLIALALLIVPMGGCQLFNEKLTAAPHAPYPEEIARGEVFDVQVFRDVTLLKFTNTTTRDFGPSVLWLNKRYSYPISGLASGETVEIDLNNFVDEYGDVYRAGGFYAQRSPAPVVLVELETTENGAPILHGFVVVENRYD